MGYQQCHGVCECVCARTTERGCYHAGNDFEPRVAVVLVGLPEAIQSFLPALQGSRRRLRVCVCVCLCVCVWTCLGAPSLFLFLCGVWSDGWRWRLAMPDGVARFL